MLIIDDEYINIMALTILLKRYNLEADYAFNGREGLKKLE